MPKIIYSNLFILLLLVIMQSFNSAYGLDWYTYSHDGLLVALDEDSIVERNDSIYYNVKYNGMVVTIQSKVGIAGVVSTCYEKDFEKNQKIADTNTAKEAKTFKKITPSSTLYEVDNFVHSIVLEDIDWSYLLNKYANKLKRKWISPQYGQPIKSTILRYKIDQHGYNHNIELIQSSGSKSHDNAAKEATIGGVDLYLFPSNTIRHYLPVEVTFNYYSTGELQSITCVQYKKQQETAKHQKQIASTDTKQPQLQNQQNSANVTSSSPASKPATSNSSSVPSTPPKNTRPSGVGNPAGGGGHPGIDAVREPDFGPYMRDVQKKIKSNWDPPEGDKSKRVVLLFKIAKDGSLLSCSVKKSSWNSNVDYAAIKAVKQTAPFPPLPPEFKGQSIDIQFTFDYNIIR